MPARAPKAEKAKKASTGTLNRLSHGETAMNLEHLLVIFKGNRTVLADVTP